jgi:hypothetical protein
MSRTLNRAGEELATAVNELAAAKVESQYLDVASQLEAVKRDLNSRDLFAISLAQEIEYLNEIEMSARIASARLGDQEMAMKLAERGDELLARGMSNIEQEFQLESEMATRFRDMDELMARANRIVGAQASVASQATLAKTLGATSSALSAKEAEFHARQNADRAGEILAVRGVDSRVASRDALLHRLDAKQAP